VLVPLIVLAPGCGASTGPSVARMGATTTTTAMTTTNASAATGSDPALAYARCMRSHGVPAFPDPASGGGFFFKTGSGVDPSLPGFKSAQASCKGLIPGGGPPAAGTSTRPDSGALAHFDAVAKCMRRHGISDFPDPTTTVPAAPAGGGVISIINGVVLTFPHTIDTRSPAFVKSAGACGFPLHNH